MTLWRAWWLGLALMALEAWGFPPSWPEATVFVGWLVGAVLLEVQSGPTRHWGSFQTSTAWTLACAGQGPGGFFLLQTWLLVRIAVGLARRGVWESESLLVEWAASLVLPVAASLAPSLAEPLALATFVAVQEALLWGLGGRLLGARFPAWRSLERRLLPLRGAALLAAGVLGRAPLLLLPLWPILASLAGAGRQAVDLEQANSSLRAQLRRVENQEQLRRAVAEGAQARQMLQLARQEAAWFEALLARFDCAGDLPGAAQGLLGSLHERLRPQRSCILWSSNGQPEELRGLAGDPLDSWLNLHHGTEVAAVLRDQVPLVLTEEAGLLLPLGHSGLLWLGRNQPWNDEEMRWLGWLLKAIRPSWAGLVEQWAGRERSARLISRLRGQQAMLQCAYSFSFHLGEDGLWGELLQWLQHSLVLQGLAWVGPGGARLFWGEGWRQEGLENLWQRLASTQSPIYLARVDHSRWPLNPGPFENLLGLPLREAGQSQGGLLIAHAGEFVWDREQLEALGGVADLLCSALRRARLHREVVEGHQRLQRSQEHWLDTQKRLALAQMSAGVAHELNSPLAAIQLSLEALQPTAAEGSHRKRMERGLQACTRAREIINHLGLLARQEGRKGNCDMAQRVRETLQQLDSRIDSLGVTVELACPDQLVVPISAEEAEPLFLPLLINALEAVAEVEPPRVVTLRLSPETLEVGDNGPGISPEVRARITEPFFTTKTIGKNIGLGLASVDQACRRCGARLEVDSRPGQGSLFRVIFARD